MKRHIQIKESYNVWQPKVIKCLIDGKYSRKYGDYAPNRIKNYKSLVIEWWLHNIGYWLTKPFTFIPALKKINIRCKDIDLLVEVVNGSEDTE